MVGYRPDDTMTSNQKLMAGVVSGIITRCVTQPMEVIKLRAQLMKKPKKHNVVHKIAAKILHEEGLQAFWYGHLTGQVHSILSVSSQFYVYEIATKYTSRFDVTPSSRLYINFICGVTAGCVSTALVIPLEVIRVRQTLVHDQYRGLLRGAKNVYKSGGLAAFYEGLSASLLQTGPAVGISFTTFRLTQNLILNILKMGQEFGTDRSEDVTPTATNLLIASTIAGSIAGFVSKTITYPLDLMKRRLQIASHVANTKYKIPSQVAQLAQCNKLSQCFHLCYKKEGLPGFFRGWTVTIFKSQMTSIIAYTSYEMLCFVIRGINT